MTLVSEIIQRAYRASNLIAIGESPTAAQSDEALVLLNGYRASVYGTEAGEQLDGILIGQNNVSRPSGYPWYNQVPDNSDWFVPLNTRLYLNLTSAQTVYLHPNPIDGSRFAFIDKSGNLSTYNLTVNANGRTINGAESSAFSTDSAANEYFYRADLGEWVLIDPLIISDDWPFPTEFDDMFVIGVAIRLNPQYVQETQGELGAQFRRLDKMFKARYRQSIQFPPEEGLLRLSGTKRRYTRVGNSEFATGRSWRPYS